MSDPIYRMTDLMEYLKLGKSTIFAYVARGMFPQPRSLTPGGRAVGWRKSEGDAWLTDPDAWVAAHTKKAEEMAA